jgi:predicted alpha-1,2-mannosidase
MMHARLAIVVFASAALLAACGDDDSGAPEPAWAPAPYTQYVDPFIGSGGFAFSHGSPVVGASAPFGMVRLSPDTTAPLHLDFHHYSGYYHDDTIIRGFSHLHFHGTGAHGYGNLLFMPVPGFSPEKITERGYRSTFDKDSEVATPGYYSAQLDNGDVLAELTSTGRTGSHRYTFGAGSGGAAVVIDAGAQLASGKAQDIRMTIDPAARRITGSLRGIGGMSRDFDLYWVIAWDTPTSAHGTWAGSTVTAGSSLLDAPTGGGGAWLEFDIPDGGVVQFRVGLSFVDLDGAIANLEAEAPAFDFDGIRTATESRWEDLLARLKIEETDPSRLRMFYSAAYRTLVTPTIYNDVDRRYRGFDGRIHLAEGFDYYSDLSMWDTFRTLHPWLTLVYPEVQSDIITSLLKMYEQDGFLPIWPVATRDSGTMIGASAELVIADSYVKGVRDYDVDLAYEAVTRSGREPRPEGSSSPGRRHIGDYLSLGYVPRDSAEKGTSMTLEYAASDGALAEFARAYGRPADAAEFAGRAQSYLNVWDPETRFFRARHRDGSFKAPFDPNGWDMDYTESTAWQYLWYVPHDPQGLISLFGGRDSFVAALEDFFALSKAEHDNPGGTSRINLRRYYWASNEPDIHAAYLFSDAGRPDLAGKWSRWALETTYGDGPDGLPGNDDCGTMSAWYLFTALGFYPVPGFDKYYVGAPLHTNAEISLPAGALRISAPAAAPGVDRPVAASVDGDALGEQLHFRHSDIADGGRLEVELAAE